MPMVSTGHCSANAASDATNTATSRFGQRGRQRRKPTMIAMVSSETPMAAGVNVNSETASASSLGHSGAGSGPAS